VECQVRVLITAHLGFLFGYSGEPGGTGYQDLEASTSKFVNKKKGKANQSVPLFFMYVKQKIAT